MDKSQEIEKAKATLLELREVVTYSDKLTCALALRANIRTLEKYLRGDIKKPGFALELIASLNTAIAERNSKAYQPA